MSTVTNRARGPRVLALANGRHATLAPGQTADLDLAAHPVHDAWIAMRQLEVSGPAEPPALTAATETPTESVNERKRQRAAHVG